MSQAANALEWYFFQHMAGCELQEIDDRKWIPCDISKGMGQENGIKDSKEVLVVSISYLEKLGFHPIFSQLPSKGTRYTEEWLLARNGDDANWKVAGFLGAGRKVKREQKKIVVNRGSGYD